MIETTAVALRQNKDCDVSEVYRIMMRDAPNWFVGLPVLAGAGPPPFRYSRLMIPNDCPHTKTEISLFYRHLISTTY